MKAIFTFSLAVIATFLMAQPSASFNYQAVLRDSSSSPIAGQAISARISILPTSASGSSVFTELHTATTNSFGMFTLTIGEGNILSGNTLADLNFGGDKHFLKVEIDAAGGTNYSNFGTQELLYVPYALNAATAEDVDDADADPLNELQLLSYSNDTLSLSNGNKVYLRAGSGGINLDNDSTNELQVLSYGNDSLRLSDGNAIFLPIPTVLANLDNDSTNELQNLVLVQDTLMLTDGNFVVLPAGGSEWMQDANGINYQNGHVGIGTDARSNRTLTIDHTSNNNATVQIIGKEQFYNTIQFSDSADAKRISMGMSSQGAYDNAFTIGTYNGSWSNPFVVSLGAPNQSVYVDTMGRVAIGGHNNPLDLLDVRQTNGATQSGVVKSAATIGIEGGSSGENRGMTVYSTSSSNERNVAALLLAGNADENVATQSVAVSQASNNTGVYGEASSATGRNFGVHGFSNASSPNQWENAGLRGELNSDSAVGRATYSSVYGSNGGFGLFSEAATQSFNTGAAGYALSRTGNDAYMIGTRGEARGDWDPNLGIGQGTHVGVYAFATSDSGFALGTRTQSQSNSGPSRGIQGSGFTTSGDFAQGVAGFATGISTNDSTFGNSGVLGVASSGNTNYGVYGYNFGTDGNHNAGVYGQSISSASRTWGVDGTTEGTGDVNYGIGGYAIGANSGTSKRNIGVLGWAEQADTNLGVVAEAIRPAQLNIALEATAANATVNLAALLNGDVQINGNLNVTGNVAKGGGTFKIDHPLDPENKVLVHSFVESPEMMNVYSGNVTTNANGEAIVKMPEYFMAANKDFRYQLTPIGQFAQAIVLREIENNTFVIKTDKPNVKISWQVTSVRADKYANEHRIVPEQSKETEGYIHPELYGKESKAEQAARKAEKMAKEKKKTPARALRMEELAKKDE